MSGARSLRRFSIGLVLTLVAAAPSRAGGGSDWSPVTPLDPRPPLEFGPPLEGVELPGGRLPFAALFPTVPELVLGRFLPGPGAPSADFVPIVTDGAIFAVSPISQLPSGRIGGSFVDNFDLKFFACDPPCNTVNVFTVDAGPEVWIDSSSARAGNRFFVASVDNGPGTIHVSSSSDGGATWQPVRTLTPAGGVYRNFDGGERVSLIVDPNGDPANVRNCLFYERLVSPTLTAKRINCADGAVVAFDVPAGADVPNAQGQADKHIENSFRFTLDVGLLLFDHRSDQSVHMLRIEGSGGQDNIVIGASPPGPEFFSFGLAAGAGDDRIDIVVPAGTGAAMDHLRIDVAPPPPFPTDFEVGPVGRQGPVFVVWPDTVEGSNGHLQAFFRIFGAGLGESDGLGVASFPVAIFADGFGTGNASRWSSTTP